jgi:hypothetical protein
MIFAVFMLAILVTLFAMWRGHVSQMPMFLITGIAIVLFLLWDMDTALNLSF